MHVLSVVINDRSDRNDLAFRTPRVVQLSTITDTGSPLRAVNKQMIRGSSAVTARRSDFRLLGRTSDQADSGDDIRLSRVY